MDNVLLLAGAILLFVGMAMSVFALAKHTTAAHPPVPSFNPKHWKPIWRTKD